MSAPKPQVDTSEPAPARVYDFLLGGKDNYLVDRAMVASLPPEAQQGARLNRGFMHRAVEWVANRGVTQFLDIGAGIPIEPNLHQVAQAISPVARIVYTDSARSFWLTPRPCWSALRRARPTTSTPMSANRRASWSAREHLDFDRPIALSLIALVHFLPRRADPYRIVRTLVDALPLGSYLLLSHGTLDAHPQHRDKLAVTYPGFHPRSRAEVARFCEPLDLLNAGVVMVEDWYGTASATPDTDSPSTARWRASTSSSAAALSRTTPSLNCRPRGPAKTSLNWRAGSSCLPTSSATTAGPTSSGGSAKPSRPSQTPPSAAAASKAASPDRSHSSVGQRAGTDVPRPRHRGQGNELRSASWPLRHGAGAAFISAGAVAEAGMRLCIVYLQDRVLLPEAEVRVVAGRIGAGFGPHQARGLAVRAGGQSESGLLTEAGGERDLGQDRAHISRMYDYYLGGKTNYLVDREAAWDVITAFPAIEVAARAGRAYMQRAVRHIAEQGVRQFLEVGVGIPAAPNVHQVVQDVRPGANVVYVDNDPIVVVYGDGLGCETPEGIARVVEADMRRPDELLAAVERTGVVDLDQPVALTDHFKRRSGVVSSR